MDVAAAAERIQAAAVLEQAEVAWLPSVTLGGDYNRHDGRNQDKQGNVFDNSRSSGMLGVGTGIGPAAILNLSEALFAPLAARQQLRAREADRQAAANDTLVAVTAAYFNVQQARGELAGAALATRRTEELVQRTRKLAPALVPELETDRAEAELARSQQAELFARERWQVASAELLRVLRLDPSAQVDRFTTGKCRRLPSSHAPDPAVSTRPDPGRRGAVRVPLGSIALQSVVSGMPLSPAGVALPPRTLTDW